MKKSTVYILLIEDHPINASIFRKIFKRSGIDCMVHLAVTAHEALQHLSQVRYDAIIVDLCMPRSSVAIDNPFAEWLNGSDYGDYEDEGERVIKYCIDKGIDKSSKVIISSASGFKVDKMINRYGTSLFKLVKPFPSDDLIQMIRSDF